MTTRRIIFLIAVLLAVLWLDWRSLTLHASRDLAIDFNVYARAVSQPISGIYRQAWPMPFLYPPTAILLFKPVSLLPAGFVIWTVLSIAAFGAAVATVAGWRAAILSFLSQSAVKGLIVGQAPMLLGAAMFVGLRLAGFTGGAIWGAAATIKPQLMLFAPLAMLVRRDWKLLSGMVAGAAAMVLASIMLFGFQPWIDWVAAVNRFGEQRLLGGAVIWTVTPIGKAILVGLPPLPFLLVSVGIATCAVIVGARRLENEQLIALIVAASLIASPYAYIHDAIALIPACVILMLKGRWWAAIPAAMILIGTPFLTMTGLMAGLMLVAAWPLIEKRRGASPSSAKD